MLKKLFAIFLSLVAILSCALSLVGCSGKDFEIKLFSNMNIYSEPISEKFTTELFSTLSIYPAVMNYTGETAKIYYSKSYTEGDASAHKFIACGYEKSDTFSSLAKNKIDRAESTYLYDYQLDSKGISLYTEETGTYTYRFVAVVQKSNGKDVVLKKDLTYTVNSSVSYTEDMFEIVFFCDYTNYGVSSPFEIKDTFVFSQKSDILWLRATVRCKEEGLSYYCYTKEKDGNSYLCFFAETKKESVVLARETPSNGGIRNPARFKEEDGVLYFKSGYYEVCDLFLGKDDILSKIGKHNLWATACIYVSDEETLYITGTCTIIVTE